MNGNRPQTNEFELPPELRSVVAMLDAAAGTESAPAGFEDRIFHASLPSLKGLADVDAKATSLGARDRAAATVGLEARVVDASTIHLVTAGLVSEEAARVHLAGEGRLAPAPRRRSWANTARLRALAALLLVGIGGAIAWQVGRPGATTSLPPLGVGEQRTAELRARLDEGLDTLLSAVADANTHASKDTESAQPSSSYEELWDEGVSG